VSLDAAALARAVATNHRAWMRRQARLSGGESLRFGTTELIVGDRWASLPFPPSAAALDPAVAAFRRRRVREASCWALRPDRRLGVELVAQGFGWGWQPHWMAVQVGRVAPPPGRHEVVPAMPPYASDLPYRSTGPDPRAVVHLGVRRDDQVIGHVAVHPWRGVAGLYAMGVAPAHRREGIGRELTLAACQAAERLGCTWAVLNATDEGERLYRACGFVSLGFGQTWWWFPGARPGPRQQALARAVGSGDRRELDRLSPSEAELRTALPGGTSPLRLAVVTGQTASAAWMLARAPGLAAQRLEPHGGTLLHLAVESDRLEFVALALAGGVDPEVRDESFDGTALGWAEHLGRARMAEILRHPKSLLMDGLSES
jgi:GNAT superfamily N-acetyltransferase